MAELILTIPGSRPGAIAVEHLASRGREVGCEYLGSLSRYLEGLNAAAYLQSLPFTFHLVATEDGREAAAMNRILRWHSGEIPDWPHGRVDAAEPNLPLYPLAPLGLPFQRGGQDGTYRSMMRVYDAHTHGARGAGVRVTILDTGLDPKATLTPQDFFDVEDTSNLHPVPPAPIDHDGHGTAMADLIHAVAPDADIYVVRVLDTGALNLWNLLAGVGVAVADCAADIVNISLGFSGLLSCPACGAPFAVRSLAFETATPGTAKLPIYVAATGNSSSTTTFDFPASSAKCVAVGAVDSARQRASFSSYGTSHRRYLMAPGGQGTGTTFTEDVGTGGTGAGANPCAGTSVSAAYVSGMLALFRSDARYALLGRDNFIDSILANQCVLPPHAAGQPLEYGSGVIEYTPPVTASGAGGGAGASTSGAPIWSDGTHVYIGGVRLKINTRY
jgi:hypothetical protein